MDFLYLVVLKDGSLDIDAYVRIYTYIDRRMHSSRLRGVDPCHAAMLRANTFMWAGPRALLLLRVLLLLLHLLLACLTLLVMRWLCMWMWMWLWMGGGWVVWRGCARGCSNSTAAIRGIRGCSWLLLLCTRKIDCGESWKAARYARGLTWYLWSAQFRRMLGKSRKWKWKWRSPWESGWEWSEFSW